MNTYRKMYKMLEKYGWATGDFVRVDFKREEPQVIGVCLMGAYALCRGYNIDDLDVDDMNLMKRYAEVPIVKRLAEFLMDLYPGLREYVTEAQAMDPSISYPSSTIIARWNDDYAEDRDSVLNILDKLACELEAETPALS